MFSTSLPQFLGPRQSNYLGFLLAAFPPKLDISEDQNVAKNTELKDKVTRTELNVVAAHTRARTRSRGDVGAEEEDDEAQQGEQRYEVNGRRRRPDGRRLVPRLRLQVIVFLLFLLALAREPGHRRGAQLPLHPEWPCILITTLLPRKRMRRDWMMYKHNVCTLILSPKSSVVYIIISSVYM